MRARDLMTRDPQCVTPDDSVSRAAELMRDQDTGIIPVVADTSSRRLRGVITDRDIAVRHVAEKHGDDCRVSNHMTDSVASVAPDTDAEEVLRLMAERQVRRVPVVENEQIVGIIAQADVARELGSRAPEKVERTIERISEPGR
jgi:CBS domain-containing protein